MFTELFIHETQNYLIHYEKNRTVNPFPIDDSCCAFCPKDDSKGIRIG